MVIQVLNLANVLGDIENIKDVDLSTPIREGTRKVQRTAKQLCPVDTGTLQASIHVKPLWGSTYEDGGVVYTAVEYAGYQEFGTSNMKAQPYMNPAMKIEREGIIRDTRNYIKDHVQRNA